MIISNVWTKLMNDYSLINYCNYDENDKINYIVKNWFNECNEMKIWMFELILIMK